MEKKKESTVNNDAVRDKLLINNPFLANKISRVISEKNFLHRNFYRFKLLHSDVATIIESLHEPNFYLAELQLISLIEFSLHVVNFLTNNRTLRSIE